MYQLLPDIPQTLMLSGWNQGIKVYLSFKQYKNDQSPQVQLDTFECLTKRGPQVESDCHSSSAGPPNVGHMLSVLWHLVHIWPSVMHVMCD